MVDDPRFADFYQRGKNREQLIAMIEEWLQSFPDDRAALDCLAKHRVPAAPVLTIEETMEHPHFVARQMVRQVPDPVLGEVTIPGFPFKFSDFPELPHLEAPRLGEHNGEVLERFLGRSRESSDALQRQGVLHSATT